MILEVSTENPNMVRAIHENPKWQSAELYRAESNGHKYKPGEIRTLTGLRDFPEHNGKRVKITAIRKDGKFGKAYYIEGTIPLNWVYEYRLV